MKIKVMTAGVKISYPLTPPSSSLLSSSLSSSYPENGVVEMRPVDVRPRARTLLRWDDLQVGMHVMVNYNMETPDERGFWFDAEVQTLNQASRTNKELRVKILLG